MGNFAHEPVMVAEVVDAFAPVPAGLLVDGTVGGGGHAGALLEARRDSVVLGLDRDAEAVAAAGERLSGYGARALVRQSGFEDLAGMVASPEVAALGLPAGQGVSPRQGRREPLEVVGVLFDLGVSSWQLDEPGRGFAFRVDAPLDMRMDRSQALSALDVVNGYEEAELARVIARYGEERFARAIARAIVAHRPVETTAALAEVVKQAIPAPARRTGPHPARRTFQAIRMEVNAELDHLGAGLDAAFSVLAPGGRLAVLSYHSLEDRMVKERFVAWSSRPPVPRGLPVTGTPGPVPPGRLVTRGAARPGAAEVAVNPRAESARLRVLERPAPGGES
ncbi:MAG TPA: 16S rRNA (cytosine(1402)-N(4))-methyltransferase RsmH [Acidimicrobiia bacterium]|nr:16S rRNA (cytosine(1402)-N(4))-methyltransferase RsmH [Acidimicrobiia bacterium]